jgi:hypothetical protein
MNPTRHARNVRTLLALPTLLLVLTSTLGAGEKPAKLDAAAQLLAAQGRVPVSAAGPYVEPGTYRIQVATKLGQPDAKLPDGTWLYHRRSLEGSEARGTLVVQFERGRVKELSLVAPAMVAALRARPAFAQR